MLHCDGLSTTLQLNPTFLDELPSPEPFLVVSHTVLNSCLVASSIHNLLISPLFLSSHFIYSNFITCTHLTSKNIRLLLELFTLQIYFTSLCVDMLLPIMRKLREFKYF